MDPAQLMQLINGLRASAMSGAQPGGLLDNPQAAPPAMPPAGAGYMRPGAAVGPAAMASPAGLLTDPSTAGGPPAVAPGAPAGFPGPMATPGSMMPMDRLRAMGQIGGQPMGMRINSQLPALPPWLTMGKSPAEQMAAILNIGKGGMLGQAPAAAAPGAAAPAKKMPNTLEDFVNQYAGNSRNQGSAGDNAAHFDRSAPAAGNTNPGYGAGGM